MSKLYFGYKEDWVCIPLEDLTDKHWFITGESHEHKCVYSDEPLTLESIQEDFLSFDLKRGSFFYFYSICLSEDEVLSMINRFALNSFFFAS